MTSAALVEWVEVGQVAGLNVFPIKSCGGIALDHLTMDALGPCFDRRFLVVDEQGNFVTQRKFPKLACFKLELLENSIFISEAGESLEIDCQTVKDGAEDLSVKVWSDQVEALDCGEKAATFFSCRLGKKLRLAYMDPDRPRVRRKEFEFKVGFADSMPLLVINQASLGKLNKALTEPIPEDRFRANIVFNSELPWLEECAEKMKIGNTYLSNGRKCDRCVITTVDQKTGLRSSAEPLATLRSLRPSEDKKIYFGMRYGLKKQGKIKIGDPVFVPKSAVANLNTR